VVKFLKKLRISTSRMRKNYGLVFFIHAISWIECNNLPCIAKSSNLFTFPSTQTMLSNNKLQPRYTKSKSNLRMSRLRPLHRTETEFAILRGGYDSDDIGSDKPDRFQIELENGQKVFLSLEGSQALERALEIVRSRRHVEITPTHYFLALLVEPESSLRKMIVGESTTFDDVSSAVEKSLNQALGKLTTQNPAPKAIGISSRLHQVLDRAYSMSKSHSLGNDVTILIEDMVLALAEDPSIQAALTAANFPLKRLQQAAADRRKRSERTKGNGELQALEEFAHELVVDAERGRLDPVIGREAEIRRVIEILSRRTKNNPCLVGEPGVGKTAIVEGLAHRILAGDVPHGLNGTRIYSLDLAALYAGTKYRGELEERFQRIMREVEAARGQVLLFVDEIHMLLGGAGGEDAHSLANLLKPALARGLRCIGATTNNEYRTHIERDGAFERRFQKARSPPPPPPMRRLHTQHTHTAHTHTAHTHTQRSLRVLGRTVCWRESLQRSPRASKRDSQAPPRPASASGLPCPL
jgi:hypothetical protein